MEIVVTGRNVQVPDHFRVHVAEKIGRLERYDHKIVGMEVELFHERNRRQLKNCQRVEITGRGCGPAVRAEACAPDFYAALDSAVAKLEAQLRRLHDRRRVTGRRAREAANRGSSSAATAVLDELPPIDRDEVDRGEVDRGEVDRGEVDRGEADRGEADRGETDRGETDRGETSIPAPRSHDEHLTAEEQLPGRIVREKVHTAEPMSVDDALSRMELVGHDFYLFADADSGEPSVVYRRKGYDYGLIRLAK